MKLSRSFLVVTPLASLCGLGFVMTACSDPAGTLPDESAAVAEEASVFPDPGYKVLPEEELETLYVNNLFVFEDDRRPVH